MARRARHLWPLAALGMAAVGLGIVLAVQDDKPVGRLLTAAELARVAHKAGWRGEHLVEAVAVALAESGGRTNAQGYNRHKNGRISVDRGLWQINDAYWPGLPDAAAYDAAQNARFAFWIWSQHGWGKWSTWTKGLYKPYMPTATRAVAQLQGAA